LGSLGPEPLVALLDLVHPTREVRREMTSQRAPSTTGSLSANQGCIMRTRGIDSSADGPLRDGCLGRKRASGHWLANDCFWAEADVPRVRLRHLSLPIGARDEVPLCSDCSRSAVDVKSRSRRQCGH